MCNDDRLEFGFSIMNSVLKSNACDWYVPV